MNGIKKTSGRASLRDTATWLRERMIEDMLDQVTCPCDADDFELIELLDMDPSIALEDKESPWGSAPWDRGSDDKRKEDDGVAMKYVTKTGEVIEGIVQLWEYAVSEYGDGDIEGIWIGMSDSVIQICKVAVIQELIKKSELQG